MSDYKQVAIDRDHPLAFLAYQRKRGRPRLYEHQLVLFNRIGPGENRCNWCGTPVKWGKGVRAGVLVVDHLDGNPLNNEGWNLVAACNGCNTIRARTNFRPQIRDDELFVTLGNGTRTRAEFVQCEECGKQFLASVARIKRGTVSVCSKSCSGIRGCRNRWG